MSDSDIFSRVRAAVSGELGIEPDSIESGTRIKDLAGGVDSLQTLRVISRIEQQFDIELEDEVVFNIGTFGDFVSAVEQARDEV